MLRLRNPPIEVRSDSRLLSQSDPDPLLPCFRYKKKLRTAPPARKYRGQLAKLPGHQCKYHSQNKAKKEEKVGLDFELRPQQRVQKDVIQGTEKKGSNSRKSIGQVYFESLCHVQEAQIKVGTLGQ